MRIVDLSSCNEVSEVILLEDLTLFDRRAFAGEDSVVFKNLQTNEALHLYNHSFSLDEIIQYATCLNDVEAFLRKNPYLFKAKITEEEFIGHVYANSVFEVGRKYFVLNDEKILRTYSLSKFLEEKSLCWPGRTETLEEQKIVQNFPIMFYDGLENYLYENLPQIQGIDINPVNVKYRVDKENKRITLTITDIAKSIRNINRS